MNNILKLDLSHRRTDANCIHQKENSPKPLKHHLALEKPKVKSNHIKRFLAHDSYRLVWHCKPLGTQISEIATFKIGYPRLTLKEGSKVKFDNTKRFPAHDFL